MNIKRQFFQIYTELERPQFNGKDKTEHTLRALNIAIRSIIKEILGE